MKGLIKKGDIVIALSVILLIVLLLLPRNTKGSGELTVAVYEKGELTHEIPLSAVKEKREIKINGGVLLLESDGVSYIEADCPDKLCIHFGKLTRQGQTASCVPGGTVVVLREGKTGIDAMTY